MKRSRNKTIQSVIFSHYTILVGISTLAMLVVFYYYASVILSDIAKESLTQTSNAIAAGLNAEMGKANDLQKRILFSRNFRNLIFSDSALFYTNDLELQRTFVAYAQLAGGPDDFLNYQINILNLNGNYAAIGHNSFVEKMPDNQLHSMKYISDAMQLDGRKLISAPHNTLWASRDTVVVSMFRSFSEGNLLIPQAILETQIHYPLISSTINYHLSDLLYNNYDVKVIVFNERDELIYPLQSPWEDEEMLGRTIQLARMEDSLRFLIQMQNQTEGGNQIIAGSVSDFLNWTVLVLLSEEVLLSSVMDMRNLFLVLGLVIICATVLLTYGVAKKISLHNIIVSIRTHEVQAKMLAIQSQMNPHFLFNTLSVIKIMGKHGDSESVVKMCEDLSQMMRYVSDSKAGPVALKDEIAHTLRYISFINKRYQNKINCNIDIPQEMHIIEVPRLLLQPLVENSAKFVTEVYPPWTICVQGSMDDNGWTISVTDNGAGFDAAKKQELEKMFEDYTPEQTIPDTQIDGMGLINIFTRLKLTYRDKAVFKVTQSETGDTVVTIGGSI